MSGLVVRARTGLRWAAGALVRLRNSMTPGQRQTAVLALALTLAVLQSAPRHFSSRRIGEADVETAASTTGPPLPGEAALDPAPLSPFTGRAAERPSPDVVGAASTALPARTGVVRVAAVTRTGDSSIPGRDDGDVANAVLTASGLKATVVVLDPSDTAMCQKVVAAGDVVLASRGLGQQLRNCVVAAGRTVIAFDELGDLPPASPGRGQVLSSRRGLRDSLLDLGAWGVRTGALKGRVGVVSVKSVAADMDDIVRRLSALGVNIVDKIYLSEDSNSGTDISTGVLDAMSEQVDVVLFAAPVQYQRQWVAQATIVSPAMRYVVSDAFDGVVSESYPATFDGALAHTSMRVPWFARDHAQSPTQVQCEATWNATGQATLAGDETIRVYSWCENVALVVAALRAVPAGGDVLDELRTQAVQSPLTSDVGPLAGGGYGPTQDAELVWRSSCTCWTESHPFTARP